MGPCIIQVLRSRRGSAMAEAAMVLPLLILSVLTCLLVSMFFYDTTLRQCEQHQQLRSASDDLTGCTVRLNWSSRPDNEITAARRGVFPVVTSAYRSRMLARGLLRTRPSSETESRWHACEPAGYVRLLTLGKGLASDP